MEPTSAAFWARNGYFFLISFEVSISYKVVSAHKLMLPSLFSRMRPRPGTRFRSTIYLGSSLFSFMAMTRSVPPARKRPPGPFSLSSRLASWSVAGWNISKASVRFMKLLFLDKTNRLRCCNAPLPIGVLERWAGKSENPSLQYSSILLPHSSDDRLERFADRFAAGFTIAHLHVSANHREHRHAFDFPAMPWRRFVLAVQLVDVDGAFLVHVNDGDVTVGAEPDRAFLRIDLPHFGGILGSNLDVLIQSQAALVYLGQD